MPRRKKPSLAGASAMEDDAPPLRRSRRIESLASRLIDVVASIGDDIVKNIFSFLPPVNIMHLRQVCKRWREAAKNTTVPLTDFVVDSVRKYNAMDVMARGALPNLQQITIGRLDNDHKYSSGDYEDEDLAFESGYFTLHNFDIIYNFRKLRILTIIDAPTNGTYDPLFNYPLLEKLTIESDYLRWDLEVLTGLPLLKELHCVDTPLLSGYLKSLRVLKDTLEKVVLESPDVEGNFMDLADFPHLKTLNLIGTTVSGDIREIGENDFLALKELTLPEGVYGGTGHAFQRISDATDAISTLYYIKKQRPTLLKDWYGQLAVHSQDWYDGILSLGGNATLPFHICFVQAGSRVGYRWETRNEIPCEVNWLDPEPDRESSDYEKYIEELQEIERRLDIYRGFYQPPNEEEYHRLWTERED